MIDYDPNQNIFWLKGLWKLDLPFTLSANYTINLPPADIPQQTSSGFQPAKDGWQIITPEIRMILNWSVSKHGLELILKMKNLSTRQLTLHNISPVIFDLEDLREELDTFSFFQHGFQSRTPSRPRRADKLQQYPRLKYFALMNQNVDSPFWGKPDGMSSSLFTVLIQEEFEPALFLGFIEQRQGLGEFYLRNRGLIQLLSFLDYGGKTIESCEEVVTETLLINTGKLSTLVDDYMTRLGQNMDARIGTTRTAGWCSGPEFKNRISEKKLLDSTRQLVSHPELGVSFVQLDDGYQTAIGDWLSLNNKFPSGLKAIADEIHQHGFKAGICLVPFVAGRNSALFREQPDWFLNDEQDQAVNCGFNLSWKTKVFALDLTHPEVEDWLKNIFAQFVAWGFDYFKVDHIFAGIRHGQRQCPALSPLESYRHGLEIIREVIGDRFLIGCGAPIGPSVGLVDAMRVSDDGLEKWHNPIWEWLERDYGVKSVSGRIRNNIQRSVMHRKLWLNDPGCLLVHDRNTDLNLSEVRTLITHQGMTGGFLSLGDNLTRLSRERLDWVKAVLPPTDLTGLPDQQFIREYPDLIRLKGRGEVIALTNWEKKARVYDLGKYLTIDQFAFDFWGKEFWEPVSARLKSHATLALQVTPKSSIPQVVATNLHLTALVDGRIAGKIDSRVTRLTVSGTNLARKQGRIWVYIPTDFTYISATLNDQTIAVESWEQGVSIAINQVPPWKLVVKFLKTGR